MTAPRMTDEATWHLPDMEVALTGKPQAYHQGRQVILSGPDDVVAVVERAEDAPWLSGLINRAPKLEAALVSSRASEAALLARVERLEGRLREMVGALDHDTSIDPGSVLHQFARAALSEKP